MNFVAFLAICALDNGLLRIHKFNRGEVCKQILKYSFNTIKGKIMSVTNAMKMSYSNVSNL